MTTDIDIKERKLILLNFKALRQKKFTFTEHIKKLWILFGIMINLRRNTCRTIREGINGA